jgi:hypothetical protein
MTAAGWDPIEGWQWACPTRSGKGAEAFAVKVSEEQLRKIADSKRVAGKDKAPEYKHTIIVEYARKATAPVSPVAPVAAPVVAPAAAVEEPVPVARVKAIKASRFDEELAALGRVNWGAKADEASKVLARGLAETRGKRAMEKLKWIIANTGIDEALMEAARVGLSTGIAVMLATGAPILDMTAADFRVVGSGAIAATLQVLVRALNPDDPKFGVGAAKAARAAEREASKGSRAR